ncbi:Nuclear protein DGCR14 [Elaphomyces granulatus]
MASSADVQTVMKRPSDSALMPPPPPPKRIKRPSTVLDEDTYADSLSHVIARDFFPGLLETQTKQEFLDALDSKDKAWIASAGKRQMMTPGRTRGRRGVNMTPRVPGRPSDTPTTVWGGGDTPASVATSTASKETTKDGNNNGPDVSNLSLGAFQSKYTSEDNESFNRLLDKQNAKRREKYAWMWSGNKILSARQIAHRQSEIKRIAAQGGQPDSSKTGKEIVLKSDLDARPAKPDSWKASPENPLMFAPSSIEDTHETIQQKAEASSRAGPKHVVYDNTRLQPTTTRTEGAAAAVPASPSISAIQDAIAGRPRPTDSEPGYTGGETPRVNGYAFVGEDEPDEDPDDSSVYSLKLLAASEDASDSTPNPFKIRENRRREELHHRMVERVARTKRAEKAANDTTTPIPRFPSSPMLDFGLTTGGLLTPGSRVGSGGKPLTPAAQKMLQRIGSTPRTSSSLSSPFPSSNLKKMWTPTPKKTK